MYITCIYYTCNSIGTSFQVKHCPDVNKWIEIYFRFFSVFFKFQTNFQFIIATSWHQLITEQAFISVRCSSSCVHVQRYIQKMVFFPRIYKRRVPGYQFLFFVHNFQFTVIKIFFIWKQQKQDNKTKQTKTKEKFRKWMYMTFGTHLTNIRGVSQVLFTIST